MENEILSKELQNQKGYSLHAKFRSAALVLYLLTGNVCLSTLLIFPDFFKISIDESNQLVLPSKTKSSKDVDVRAIFFAPLITTSNQKLFRA